VVEIQGRREAEATRVAIADAAQHLAERVVG
jgi:hypothetical protein